MRSDHVKILNEAFHSLSESGGNETIVGSMLGLVQALSVLLVQDICEMGDQRKTSAYAEVLSAGLAFWD